MRALPLPGRAVEPSRSFKSQRAVTGSCNRKRRTPALPVHTYEGMFLLDSTKAAAAWEESVKRVHDILAKHNAEIVASRQWDERRLAYPISGHKKATYLLTYFKTDGSKLKEIVADCHLSDLILRELILKVHPKLEVQLVNQAMTSTPNAEAEEASGHDDELDERPRRRRRDD